MAGNFSELPEVKPRYWCELLKTFCLHKTRKAPVSQKILDIAITIHGSLGSKGEE